MIQNWKKNEKKREEHKRNRENERKRMEVFEIPARFLNLSFFSLFVNAFSFA
jgi:heme-degrading monooxygenase HmoA